MDQISNPIFPSWVDWPQSWVRARFFWPWVEKNRNLSGLHSFWVGSTHFEWAPPILGGLNLSTGYSYSYGLIMELSKSIYQLPLLVLPHLRPLGTSVGGKLLGTGASCIFQYFEETYKQLLAEKLISRSKFASRLLENPTTYKLCFIFQHKLASVSAKKR